MAYTVTKNADGDLSIGNLRGEIITIKPAASDYPTGGYVVKGGSAGDVGMTKILGVIPIGGQGGYVPVWDPVNQKVQVFQQSAATSALTEVPSLTDLSALSMQVIAVGL